MKQVAEYTAEELEYIGHKFLLEYFLQAHLRARVLSQLRLNHREEYDQLRTQFRAEMLPDAEVHIASRKASFRGVGMRVVEHRLRYSQRRKERKAHLQAMAQGAAPVKFATAGYWTKCSCGHIAQEHDENGACPNNVGTRYNGKWILSVSK